MAMLGVVGRGVLVAVRTRAVSSAEPLLGQPGLTATTHNALTKQLLAARTNSA